MNEVKRKIIGNQAFTDFAHQICRNVRNLTAHSLGDESSLSNDYHLSLQCLGSLAKLYRDYFPTVRKMLEKRINQHHGLSFEEYAAQIGFEDPLADSISLLSLESIQTIDIPQTSTSTIKQLKSLMNSSMDNMDKDTPSRNVTDLHFQKSNES